MAEQRKIGGDNTKIPVFQIKINDGRREADQEAVHKLADSITKVGLLNPITVDQDYTLIAGLHRLEAAKLLGWTEIECNISSLEGLMAELAEIDENFVRKGLSEIEYGDLLLRRKEIYEALHPETCHGMRNGQTSSKDCNLQSLETKAFIQETADQLGVNKSTIARQIQTAKNLTPEAKRIIQETDTKITKTNALKLSRLAPEQQIEAASQLAGKKIRSVDEYHPTPAEPEATGTPPEPEPPAPPEGPEPDSAPADRCPSIQELAADLKNPDKDRRCTPNSFLVTFSYFLQRFCQSMENYTGPEYDAVLPVLTREHLDQIQQKVQFVHEALDEMYHKIERMAQNEAT